MSICNFLDLLAADANLPWYKTLRFRAYFVLAIIGMLIILCFAGLAALISGKYFDWSHRAKEQRRLKKVSKKVRKKLIHINIFS